VIAGFLLAALEMLPSVLAVLRSGSEELDVELVSLEVAYGLLSICSGVWIALGSSGCSEGTLFFSEDISPKRSSRDLSRSTLLLRTSEGSSRKGSSEAKC